MKISMNPIPILLVLLCASPAQAALITHHWNGVLKSLNEDADNNSVPYPTGLAVGDPFTVTLKYDTSATDHDPDPTVGTYAFSPAGASGITYSFPTIDVETDPLGTFTLGILNDNGLPGTDKLHLNPAANDFISSDAALDFFLPGLLPTDSNGTPPDALSSDALPTSIDLSLFSSLTIDFVVGSGGEFFLLKGELIPVPEPSSLTLVTLSFMALLFQSRIRK